MSGKRYDSFISSLLLFFIISFYSGFLFSQHSHELGNSRFIENKRQWQENILYKADIGGGTVFLEKAGMTFLFEDVNAVHELLKYKYDASRRNSKHIPENKVKYHAYKLDYIGASPNAQNSSEKPSSEYYNYYLGSNPERWASEVYKYETVVYSGLYKNIDMRISIKESNLKTDYIIYPNGVPGEIKLKYTGVDKLRIKKGNLEIETSVNTITELKPYAYQIIDGVHKEVDCAFTLHSDTVSFLLPGGYNRNYELIIDPVLIFSTYSGSTADNWGYTATYDNNGFVYAAGNVFDNGYPVTLGAYQTAYNGGLCDVAVTKYDTTGSKLIYSTYIGGSGPEVPHSIFVNSNNELFIFGTTGSSDFPVTPGAYDVTFNGGQPYVLTYVLDYDKGSDIYVSKLKADGKAMLASTYIGGTGNDGLNTDSVFKHNYADDVRGEVLIDANNNCYIVTSTQSPDFPVTSNAFHPFYGGGDLDGCIVKIDNNLKNMIWSSYLGGAAADAVYAIAIDKSNNIYVCGGTTSVNFPVTSGTLYPSYSGGSCDGFVTKINTNGSTIMKSTFYGSGAYDQTYLIELDKHDNVYVFGQTEAKGNTFIYNAAWNMPNSGQFISKMKPDLNSLLWSTAFGTGSGKPDISPTAFMVDLCDNIYLSGWGGNIINGFGGTAGLPITPDAFQKTTDNNDYYFLVLRDDASALVYGTYFGGTSQEHVDGGTSRFDKYGKIYQSVCAGCGGIDDFPTTPNAWSNTNNSSNCNNAVIKFDFMLPVTIADFETPSVGCAPYNVSFKNNSFTTSGQGVTNFWDFGDGNTSTQSDTKHTFLNSGIYKVVLIVKDNGSCNGADTISKNVIVLKGENNQLPTKDICKGDFVQIGLLPLPDTSLTYNWLPALYLSDTKISNPIASPITNMDYSLLVSNGICTDTLFQKVVVHELLADAGKDTVVCPGLLTLKASASAGGSTFVWSSSPLFTDTLNISVTDNSAQVQMLNDKTYYVNVSDGYCSVTDSVRVTVSQVSIIAGNDQIICQGDTAIVSVTNLNPNNPLTYLWNPSAYIITGVNASTATVNPPSATSFVVIATDSVGCKKTDTVVVNVSAIEALVTKKDVSCYGYNDGSAYVTPLISGNYIYKWSNNTIGNRIDSVSGGVYYVTVTDSSSCEKVFEVVIHEPQLLKITDIVTTDVGCDSICDGLATLYLSGGTLPYTYQWITGQKEQTAVDLCAGSYPVTVNDSNGCSVDTIAQVKDTSDFNAKIDSIIPPLCYDDCNAMVYSSASGGKQPYSYYWDNGDKLNYADGYCHGVHNVIIVEENGCLRNIYFAVPQPEVLKGIPGVIKRPTCNKYSDATAEMGASGGTPPYKYLWSNNQQTPIAVGLSAGTYFVTITDANNCTVTEKVVIEDTPPFTGNVKTSKVPCDEVCNGVATSFPQGGVPPYKYEWSNNTALNPAVNLCSGIYYVSVTDSLGCMITDNFNITDSSYFPPKIYTYADDSLIYVSQTTKLHTSQLSGFLYSWTPDIHLNTPDSYVTNASPLVTTTFFVTIKDKFGCEYIDSVRVIVKDVFCDESQVYVPNAFSPNGDNNNDFVYVRSNILKDIYFVIFDRWGEKVFETYDMTKGWNGSFRGKECNPGVFDYYLKATCINNMEFIKKGNITLIR